jgi:DNA-directed RNA polymerase specialized sigma24 family protein
MGSRKPSERLSRIKTRWTMVFQAHKGDREGMESAQQRLLLGYYGPVYRYLRAMVRDADAAEELTQEFAVRFLRGDFKRADPSRGRFRDLVKRALRHLAIDFWRRKRVDRKKTPFPLPDNGTGNPAIADWRRGPPARLEGVEPNLNDVEADRTFIQSWRWEMLAQTLARFQAEAGRTYQVALRLRVEHPKECSAELARRFSARLGKQVSETAYQQVLRRARGQFADMLVAEVAASVPTSDPDAVEAELIELDLLSYCRQAVARLREANFLEHQRGPNSGATPSR